jgi:hypothetical protein
MGPRNAYKDMLDNVVSPITCVSMNHKNQLEQMAKGAMFATTFNRTIVIGSELAHRDQILNKFGGNKNIIKR